MTTKNDLFEDIAVALDSWMKAVVDATTNPTSGLQWTEDSDPYRMMQAAIRASNVDPESIRLIFSECFRGFAVSMLTILDGGSALAEKGRLYVVDEGGKKIGEGLHEDFVGYLIDTGRL